VEVVHLNCAHSHAPPSVVSRTRVIVSHPRGSHSSGGGARDL
jgi:hypothetical protein